jgi:hypothetical protein
MFYVCSFFLLISKFFILPSTKTQPCITTLKNLKLSQMVYSFC